MQIQKALGEYLERQRSQFARFYFVGDEDLLELIGNAKDLAKVQRHLRKMFAGVTALELSADGSTATAMVSKEGEAVAFRTPIVLKVHRRAEPPSPPPSPSCSPSPLPACLSQEDHTILGFPAVNRAMLPGRIMLLGDNCEVAHTRTFTCSRYDASTRARLRTTRRCTACSGASTPRCARP